MFEPILFQHGTCQRRHRLALADNIQGHSLANLTFGIAVGNQWLVAMRMHVDITGGYDSPFSRNRPLAGIRLNLANRRDFSIFDGDIAVKPRITCAVNQPATMDHSIEFGHAASCKVIQPAVYHRGVLRTTRQAFSVQGSIVQKLVLNEVKDLSSGWKILRSSGCAKHAL